MITVIGFDKPSRRDQRCGHNLEAGDNHEAAATLSTRLEISDLRVRPDPQPYHAVRRHEYPVGNIEIADPVWAE